MIKESTTWTIAIVVLCSFVGLRHVSAQPADPPSEPAAPGSQSGAKAGESDAKPASAEDVLAEVIEVRGRVERSAIDAAEADPAASKWTPVVQGEKLGGGVRIRTGLCAHLILRFGDASVVMIKRSTLASINQFYREANTDSIRLGLGYGAIRGGTSAGPVRSDFVVESTVATLAKRGTEGWEFWVEPYTGRFRVSLAEWGLVEALEKLTGRRRLVRPGEYANHANIGAMWIKQDIFDRAVHFYAAESLSPADLAANLRQLNGLGVAGPGLASETWASAGRHRVAPLSTGIGTGPAWQPPFETMVLRPSYVERPEGNFGMGPTFDVLLPKRIAKRAAGKREVPPSMTWTGVKSRVWGLAVGVTVTLTTSLLYQAGWFDWLAAAATDWGFKHVNRIDASSDIVMIDINDFALERVHRWPWPRSLHADLIGLLHELGATAILVDVVFSEPTVARLEHPALSADRDVDPALEVLGDIDLAEAIEDDMLLDDALRAAGNVYPAMFLRLSKPEVSVPDLLAAAADVLSDAPSMSYAEFADTMGGAPSLELEALYHRGRIVRVLNEDLTLEVEQVAARLDAPPALIDRYLAGMKRFVVRRLVADYLRVHPNAAFAEVRAHFLPGLRPDQDSPARQELLRRIAHAGP